MNAIEQAAAIAELAEEIAPHNKRISGVLLLIAGAICFGDDQVNRLMDWMATFAQNQFDRIRLEKRRQGEEE